MMQITSPFITSKLTPLSTSSSPKLLCTSLSETMGWSGVHPGAAVMSDPHNFTAYFRSSATVRRAIG